MCFTFSVLMIGAGEAKVKEKKRILGKMGFLEQGWGGTIF